MHKLDNSLIQSCVCRIPNNEMFVRKFVCFINLFWSWSLVKLSWNIWFSVWSAKTTRSLLWMLETVAVATARVNNEDVDCRCNVAYMHIIETSLCNYISASRVYGDFTRVVLSRNISATLLYLCYVLLLLSMRLWAHCGTERQSKSYYHHMIIISTAVGAKRCDFNTYLTA